MNDALPTSCGRLDLIDELRGELDRSHGVGLGWSGPVTPAYLRGFGTPPQWQEQRDAAADADANQNHGWYT